MMKAVYDDHLYVPRRGDILLMKMQHEAYKNALFLHGLTFDTLNSISLGGPCELLILDDLDPYFNTTRALHIHLVSKIETLVVLHRFQLNPESNKVHRRILYSSSSAYNV